MKQYIALKDWDHFPKYEDLVAFVFDESFRKRRDLGFDFSYDKKTKQPNFVMLRWPKFKDNPDIAFAGTSVIRVIFSPITISHSKIVQTKRLSDEFHEAAPDAWLA